MLQIYKIINYLIALCFWSVAGGDCFFFNKLFITLENNVACIYFFNNLFFVYNKQFAIMNYNNIFTNTQEVTNQNLLNGSINIHPIFFLILINFVLVRYFRMY